MRRDPSFRRQLARCLVSTAVLVSCAKDGPSTSSGGNSPDGGVAKVTHDSQEGGIAKVTWEPGTVLALSSPLTAEREAIDQKVAALSAETAASLVQRSALPFATTLGYEPEQALHFELLQQSNLQLTSAERAIFRKNGFVWKQQAYPNFTYGYASIYAEDLPVFISADSMMYAIHRSYDELLAALEVQVLLPALHDMLARMRQNVATTAADRRADVDIYLAVALGLARGEAVRTIDDANNDAAHGLYELAKAASGTKQLQLFGSTRDEDFSQYRPRGHYTDNALLSQYFRATTWLGRTDLRLIETQSDGSQAFRRRQLLAAYTLRELMDDTALADWSALDRVVSTFVGEPDFMGLRQLDSLLGDLHLTSSAGLAGLSDQAIAQAIIDGGYGTQRILSHIILSDSASPLPFNSSFALSGQRYVVDSHVFSNVVFDRVAGRMMPNPLDVAFAALANDHAAALLAPELESKTAPTYAGALAKTRLLIDSYPAEFWQNSLYNRWLTALRTLSPKASELTDPQAAGLPKVATTEAWGRRLLNTQLASWAELRHDTILYAKQSYSTGVSCEFPDAYVEPNPAFFRALAEYAEHGGNLMTELRSLLPGAATTLESAMTHFSRLRDVSVQLEDMASRERTGTPFTAEQLAFINKSVTVQEMCGGASARGWYPELFFGSATTADPTIADVHTQPTDELGNEVGRVLHVGTGDARPMVVTFDTCVGPRVYVGLVSSYYEKITQKFERLDDRTWASRFRSEAPVAWAQALTP